MTGLELIGGIEKRDIVLVEHTATWADVFATHRSRVAAAVGLASRGIEHIGSTSVPGLAAKPIVDVLLLVDDITAESKYLDPLTRSGYVVRVREPGHRMLRTPELDVHLHVFEPGTPAAEDLLLLREHLRRHEADRDLYERTKRDLAGRDWPDMNAYANAKSEVIAHILHRARSAPRDFM